MLVDRFDTVIISDLHLGSEISRARDALELLESVRFSRLILLGDIFADLNFSRLTKEHWKFLGYIRKLSNPRHQIEVVWVEGNHDHGLAELMSHLVGVPVYQHYSWEFDGKHHLAVHGHQFDSFAINNHRLSRIGQFFYLQLQKLDSRSKKFARYLDRLNTRWLRLSAQVAQGALSYAKQGKAERIFSLSLLNPALIYLIHLPFSGRMILLASIPARMRGWTGLRFRLKILDILPKGQ